MRHLTLIGLATLLAGAAAMIIALRVGYRFVLLAGAAGYAGLLLLLALGVSARRSVPAALGHRLE